MFSLAEGAKEEKADLERKEKLYGERKRREGESKQRWFWFTWIKGVDILMLPLWFRGGYKIATTESKPVQVQKNVGRQFSLDQINYFSNIQILGE